MFLLINVIVINQIKSHTQLLDVNLVGLLMDGSPGFPTSNGLNKFALLVPGAEVW
jgi:hypothetical protein